jgi:hypothetical protein
MRILIACEESQAVCKAFRKLGHEAYSCDILDCSGGHPEWHIKGDVLEQLDKGWDMIIAHPPCTYLTVSGNAWFNVEKYGDKAIERTKSREEAIEFFMKFVNAKCDKIVIENPIGVISSRYRKPDQIIQPWQFGHPYTKSTCLWIKGLPLLSHTNVLEKPTTGWLNQSFTPSGRYGGFNGKFSGSSERSKTFQGIADAMAEQWG